MYYKTTQKFNLIEVQKFGDRFEEIARKEFSRHIAGMIGQSLVFEKPTFEGAPKDPYYDLARKIEQEVTTEFVFMPKEHWDYVKRMIGIVMEYEVNGEARNILKQVIDEIENK